mgnify:CR=1 FL=1
MISKIDLDILYKWASTSKFPLKKAPTTVGYTNKDIYICGLKYIRKNVNIRKSMMTDAVYNIIKNDNILYAVYSRFAGGTILTPHKDPDVYSDRYKRIQIPLSIPDKDTCFMLWDGRKVTWEEGVHQVYPVMDVIHEGYNLSTNAMEFVMIDVKLDTIVEDEN